MIKIKNYRQTIILEDLDNKSGYVIYCSGLDKNNFLQYEQELTDIIEENLGFSHKLKEYLSNQLEVKKFICVREFVRHHNELALTQATIFTKDGDTYRTQVYILSELREILKGYYESCYLIFMDIDGKLIYLPSVNLAKVSIDLDY